MPRPTWTPDVDQMELAVKTFGGAWSGAVDEHGPVLPFRSGPRYRNVTTARRPRPADAERRHRHFVFAYAKRWS
jgi:hypothetical protein